MIENTLSDHQIQIAYEGSTRLKGGFISVGTSVLQPIESSVQDKDSVQIYSLGVNNSNKPFNVKIKSDESKGIVFIYLQPNEDLLSDPKSFVGLYFNELPGYKTGLSAYKYGSVKAWTMPKQILTMDSLNENDNQFFLWQYNDSLYAAAMPLLGKGYVSQIGSANKKFGIKTRSLTKARGGKDIPLAAIGFGKDPFKLISDLYERGMISMQLGAGLRKHKQYPAMFEQLLWCTWNSFGHQLDESKVMEGMDAFKKQGFKLPLLLLDDGWSVVSSYGTGMLKSYEPEKNKFPNGFKTLVNKLKTEYGVKEVGVWHAYNGYWRGIDPASELGKTYAKNLIKYTDRVRWVEEPESDFYFVDPMSEAGYTFYDEWYKYLKSQGISFLKVDNQLIMDKVATGNYPFSQMAAKMQTNMQTAVKNHFDGNVINCMDMTIDAVYNFGSSAIGRASEDYFPENFSYKMNAGNAAVHVMENAYNSLWWSQLVWPDFDMFQTHHPHAEYHAVARAVSGGPIYITDSPGKNNFDIIHRLIYSDGHIIRSDRPAMPTKDCLFQVQDAAPFKIQTMSGKAGMLAIFNAADTEKVEGTFAPSDVYSISGEQFAIFDYFGRQVSVKNLNESNAVQLPRMGVKLFYIVPVVNQFASFGLINKYNGPKTIISENYIDKGIDIELYEGGEFAAYSKTQPSAVTDDQGKALPYKYSGGLLTVNLAIEQHTIKISF